MTAQKTSVKIRRWRPEDIPAIVKCHRAAYQDYPSEVLFGKRILSMQLAAFPDGQFLAEADGKVVGYATSLIVQLDDESPWIRYTEVTGGSTFSTHNPSGDTLYGADVAVHPDYRRQGIAAKLYSQRLKLLKRHNLRRMVAHGRLPGYKGFEGELTPEEYVQKVARRQIEDPALNAHLRAGYKVRQILLDFMRDESSLNYCTLLELKNPDYEREKRKIAAAPLRRPVHKVRVCAAQYLMRLIRSWEQFEQAVEFFVTTADEYHCHFLVLPEFFTAQLFGLMPTEWSQKKSIRELASMSDRYIEMFVRMAKEYRLYIIGGSHPILRDGKLYNVAHLFTPSGKVYTQDKLHVTPDEREQWGVTPGNEIKVFETPLARIAIQVCYDIEFPELSRMQTHSGVEIVFVPFHTDEKKAYYRVRYTAQARAVENTIYVVIAGNVGNMPARNYLLNYGQSAILTPSDFAFPLRATAGEADPNVETVVIADLDITSLHQQRDVGSVRHLYDRRRDLYDLVPRTQVKLVRTD